MSEASPAEQEGNATWAGIAIGFLLATLLYTCVGADFGEPGRSDPDTIEAPPIRGREPEVPE